MESTPGPKTINKKQVQTELEETTDNKTPNINNKQLKRELEETPDKTTSNRDIRNWMIKQTTTQDTSENKDSDKQKKTK